MGIRFLASLPHRNLLLVLGVVAAIGVSVSENPMIGIPSLWFLLIVGGLLIFGGLVEVVTRLIVNKLVAIYGIRVEPRNLRGWRVLSAHSPEGYFLYCSHRGENGSVVEYSFVGYAKIAVKKDNSIHLEGKDELGRAVKFDENIVLTCLPTLFTLNKTALSQRVRK